MPIAAIEGICNMALGYAGVRTRINSIDEPSAAAQACKVYFEQYRDDLLNDYRWPFATRRQALVAYTGPAYAAATTYAAGALVTYGATVYRSLQAANTGNQPNLSPGWWFQVTRDGWAFAYPLPGDFVDEQFVYEKPTITSTSVAGSSFAAQNPTMLSPIRAPLSDNRIPFAVEDANDGSGNQVLLTDADSPVLVYTAQITNPRSFSGPFVKALAWRLAVPLCLSLRADPKAAEILEKKADKEVRESIATEERGIREDPEPVSDFENVREH